MIDNITNDNQYIDNRKYRKLWNKILYAYQIIFKENEINFELDDELKYIFVKDFFLIANFVTKEILNNDKTTAELSNSSLDCLDFLLLEMSTYCKIDNENYKQKLINLIIQRPNSDDISDTFIKDNWEILLLTSKKNYETTENNINNDIDNSIESFLL